MRRKYEASRRFCGHPKPIWSLENLIAAGISRRRSAAAIDEAGGLDAGFEFAADGAAVQEGNLRRDLERLQHVRADALLQCADIDPLLGLDEEPQHVEAVLRIDHLGLEVGDALIEEHQVFELGVVDIDAAHLEEA